MYPTPSTNKFLIALSVAGVSIVAPKVDAALIRYETTGALTASTSANTGHRVGEQYKFTAVIDTDTEAPVSTYFVSSIESFNLDIASTMSYVSGTGGEVSYRKDANGNVIALNFNLRPIDGAVYAASSAFIPKDVAIFENLEPDGSPTNLFTGAGFPIGAISIFPATGCDIGLWLRSGTTLISGSIDTSAFAEVIPEPSSAALLGLGALAALRRKKSNYRLQSA